MKTILIILMISLFIGCQEKKLMNALDCAQICPYGVKKFGDNYMHECECYPKGGGQ